MADCTNAVECPTPRKTLGRHNISTPAAIVLIPLPLPIEGYRHEVALPAHFSTAFPQSVHFAVGYNGTVLKFVDLGDTAWGLPDYKNPQWPYIPTGTDANAPFIFIGLEGLNPNTCTYSQPQLVALVNLLCCLGVNLTMGIDDQNVITAYTLNTDFNVLIELPSNILGQAQSCILAGGAQPVPNLYQLLDRLEAVEACCTAATTAISQLQAQASSGAAQASQNAAAITALESSVSTMTTQLASLSSTVQSVAGSFATIQNQLLVIQACIDKVCPVPNCCTEIKYTLSPNQSQVITPNVAVRINFPTRVTDTTPPNVSPGPLWKALLNCGCIWDAKVAVRFAPAEFCANRKVWVDLHYCGATHRIGEFVGSGAIEPVVISGSTLIQVPPACDDIYVTVGTDDTTMPNKVVTYGEIQLICA